MSDTDRYQGLNSKENDPHASLLSEGLSGESGVIYYSFSELKTEIASKEWYDIQCHLLRCMALNNSVQPLIEGKDTHFSASYEEKALVQEAEKFGFKLASKTTEVCLLEEFGVFIDYDILAYRPYKKEIPKCRIFVRRGDERGGIFYVKGHPQEVIKNCTLTRDQFRHFTDHLSILSSTGLGTMAYSYRAFRNNEVEEFIRKLEVAKSSPINSNQKIEELFQEFEKEMVYAGLTGLEEFVSPESKEAIHTLQNAGIKMWVASGDGRNNSLASAINSGIIPHDMPVAILHSISTEIQALKSLKKCFSHYIYHESSIPLSRSYSFIPNSRLDVFMRKCTNQDKNIYSHEAEKDVRLGSYELPDTHRLEVIHPLISQITKLENEYRSFINKPIDPKSIRFSVVIDADTFDICMKYETTRTMLVSLLFSAQSVVFSKLLPHHKSEVVKLLKNNLNFNPVTLAIGDHNSDISMILDADIGISCGKKTQLSRYSDITIRDFNLLAPLLLKHGHWNYYRMGKTIYLFLYKNLLLAVIRFINQAYVAYSSAWFINSILSFSSNYVFTSISVIFLGIIEKEHSEECIMVYPKIYMESILKNLLNTKRLLINLAFACLHGLIIYFFITQSNIITSDGMPESLTLIDTAIYITTILVIQTQMYRTTRVRNKISIACIVFPPIFMVLEMAIINDVRFQNNEHYSDIWNLSKCPVYLIIIFTAPLICYASRYAKSCLKLYKTNTKLDQEPCFGNFITFYHPRLYNLQFLSQIYKKREYFLINAEKDAYAMDKFFLNFNSKHVEEDYKKAFYNDNIKIFSGLVIASFLSIVVWTFEEIFVLKNGRIWRGIAIGLCIVFLVFALLLTKVRRIRVQFMESIFLISIGGMAAEFAYQITTKMVNMELAIFISSMTFIMVNIDYKKMLIINIINIMRTMISLLIQYDYYSDSKQHHINECILFMWRMVLLISATAISGIIGYKLEESLRNYFKILRTTEIEVQKSKTILGFLLPQFVLKRVNDGVRYIAEDQGTVSVLFCDICDFDTICAAYQPHELTAFLDDLFKKFDQLCQSFGVTKIETVGKTYMACAGLKDSEMDFDPELREIIHARRVLELGFSMIHCVTEMHTNLDNPLQIKIGINSGPVVAGVVGFHKPQFSLVGDTVNTASRMCALNDTQNSIHISEASYELVKDVDGFYFNHRVVDVKGKGIMETFNVREASMCEMEVDERSEVGILSSESRLLSFTTKRRYSHNLQLIPMTPLTPATPAYGLRSSAFPDSETSEANITSFHKMNNNSIQRVNLNSLHRSKPSNKKSLLEHLEVNKSIDIFSRNDSSLIEKTQIISLQCKESSVQAKFRMDYLDFYFKQIKHSIMIGMICSISLTVFMIVRYCMTSEESVLELVGRSLINVFLICTYSLLRKIYKKSWFPWMMNTIYFIACIIALIGVINEDNKINFGAIEVFLYILLISNASGGFLRHVIWSCMSLLFYWIIIILVFARYDYTMLKTVYLIGFIGMNCYSLYNRETQLRTHFNIKIIADREIEKTEKLLTQMMPPHVYESLKEDRSITDRIPEVTLLYADIVGFTNWSSMNSPEDVVEMLSELFTRFDKKCVELNVYKVHTIGDCYVVMGYNGESQRDPCQEALNVLNMAQSMINIIDEINEDYGSLLKMRIGVHTGEIIAGITGTNIIRYDIYGPDVLIANKMESNGAADKINVSDITRVYLKKALPGRFKFSFNKEIEVKVVQRVHKCYFISVLERD
jgi:magnesium-transporting ATPase (P-type)/class 3 adenylate cyclase